ncbi:MAG: hypothetical protein M1820_008662 [Bogoriella megaspora]|nr:MAG: hypothetical protein M1820_008662 [Bogoriella megaspora]
MFHSLINGCSVCGLEEGLSRCTACGVMLYCGRDHQAAHRHKHKKTCNIIKKARANLHGKEQSLRVYPEDEKTPAGLFDNAVGRFWEVKAVRNYMRARYYLVRALLKIDTLDAVDVALAHAMEMLRLCRRDHLGVRKLIPPLYLRLGKYQQCYDFLKWWQTTGTNPSYDWNATKSPYLDLQDEDIFEPVDIFCGKKGDLNYTVSATLLKIKLLSEIEILQRVPQEQFDNVRTEFVSSAVGERKDIMNIDGQMALIKELQAQIETLYDAVEKLSGWFWTALTSGMDDYLTCPSEDAEVKAGKWDYSAVYPVLHRCYRSWSETPGAITRIEIILTTRMKMPPGERKPD